MHQTFDWFMGIMNGKQRFLSSQNGKDALQFLLSLSGFASADALNPLDITQTRI